MTSYGRGHSEAAVEIERLRAERDALVRWKAEANEVIGQWEQVWEAAGRPGLLGESKSAATGTEIESLRAERDALVDVVRVLHDNAYRTDAADLLDTDQADLVRRVLEDDRR